MLKKHLLLLIVVIGTNVFLSGQDKKPDWRKLHYNSEAEMHMEADHQRNFYETDPPPSPVRNVAEFEQMQAVLIFFHAPWRFCSS